LDSSIVQGPVSVAPCQTLRFAIRDFFIAVRPQHRRGVRDAAAGRPTTGATTTTTTTTTTTATAAELRAGSDHPTRAAAGERRPCERPAYGDEKAANRDSKVWHGATGNGP
jgi:hypothetical protein